MTLQHRIGDRYSNARNELMVHDTEMLELEAIFACDIMKQLGIVACKTVGEDSSGRQKVELLTPTEVVDRALQISQYAFEKFREKGLIAQMPDVSAIWPVKDEKED